jgi:hypothetical protein
MAGQGLVDLDIKRKFMMKNQDLFLKRSPYFFLFGLFIILLIIGFYTYKDYGVPIDETYQRQVALKNHTYIFNRDPSLLSFKDRYYGVTFELPLFWAATRFTGPETVYIRHLLLYLAFLASLMVFYLLSFRLFRNPWWSLLAVCLLAFSPRIFSDAFYNSKDIAFMDVFILAIGTLLLVIDRTRRQDWTFTVLLVCLHAFTSALLIGTRIIGVMVVPMSMILIGIGIYGAGRSWKQVLFLSVFYLVLTAAFTILIWPVLWHDPLREAINAFRQMSKYLEYGKGVLYLGNFYPSDTLPWHYLSVWIGISTPIIVLLGFIIGITDRIVRLYHSFPKGKERVIKGFFKWLSDQETLQWITVLAWLIVPLIAIDWFHSVLYNGWRHLFFIFPPIVLLSTHGFYALHKYFSERTRRPTLSTIIIAIALVVGLFEPISFLSRYHRYGTAYFNQLAGDPKTLHQRFEIDYWGLSYKEAIDYILATDKSDKIPIYMADVSGLDYIKSMLSPDQEARFVVLDSPDKGARYFIGNYSFHPNDYYPSNLEYYSIIVRGDKILVVYRFNN